MNSCSEGNMINPAFDINKLSISTGYPNENV